MPFLRTMCGLGLMAAAGFAVGYVDKAYALDRHPAAGGFVSDGSRGYGAERPRYGSERPGYGAEREYYGASNLGVTRRGGGGYGRGSYHSQGSVIEFGEDGFDDTTAVEPEGSDGRSRAGVYPGYEAGYADSVIYLDDESADGAEAEPQLPSGPRIIDVEAERLDRRPVKEGVSVSYVGGAKIIRIASSGGGRPRAAAPQVLAPWSDPWERYCRRAHPDFDADRGTFTAKDGSTRFCTGE